MVVRQAAIKHISISPKNFIENVNKSCELCKAIAERLTSAYEQSFGKFSDVASWRWCPECGDKITYVKDDKEYESILDYRDLKRGQGPTIVKEEVPNTQYH